MKDLTQETSRQGPTSTPSLPSHYSNPGKILACIAEQEDNVIFLEPKREAPARPPPPSAGPSAGTSAAPTAAPYPVYMQSMPVPYGATTATPYPTYLPPPIPHGFNPYGTMPYPSTLISFCKNTSATVTVLKE